MFEGAAAYENGYAQGRAIRDAQDAATFRRERDEAIANLAVWKAALAERDQIIRKLQNDVAIFSADADGHLAQVEAFMAQHPDSPLMTDSGARFRDGSIKRKVRNIYEAVFDAALRKTRPSLIARDCRGD